MVLSKANNRFFYSQLEKFFKSTPLKIHCWGGLGSQLFAVACIKQIQKTCARPIKLILHTSGETIRYSELDFLNDNTFSITQIEDFKASIKKTSRFKFKSVLLNNFRIIFKFLLFSSNIFCTADTDTEFLKISPWTLSLRGHYSERTIDNEFYDYLIQQLKINNSPTRLQARSISVHYRLGDLVSLPNKNPIPVEIIVLRILRITSREKNFSISIFTEDPEIVTEMLQSQGFDYEFQAVRVPTVDVIRNCVSSDYFVGTNSKISVWISRLRSYLGKNLDDAN